MLKDRALASQPGQKLNAGQHLLASGQAGPLTLIELVRPTWADSLAIGVASALATAPIWVVKTRMFTTRRADKLAYRNVFGERGRGRISCSTCDFRLLDGLYRIGKYEGLPGLYKGTLLGIIGVSNGAVQFMAYEELKKYARERKMQRGVPETEAVDLVSANGCLLIGCSTDEGDSSARAIQNTSSCLARRSCSQSFAHILTKSFAVACRCVRAVHTRCLPHADDSCSTVPTPRRPLCNCRQYTVPFHA